MSNASCGSSFLMECASRHTDFLWYSVAIHDSDDDMYPAVSFFADGGIGGKWKHRGVQSAVSDDGRWIFVDVGEPLPFEALGRYSRKRIRDRLDRETVLGYLKQLGFDVEDEQFWDVTANAYCIRYCPDEE